MCQRYFLRVELNVCIFCRVLVKQNPYKVYFVVVVVTNVIYVYGASFLFSQFLLSQFIQSIATPLKYMRVNSEAPTPRLCGGGGSDVVGF